jgi:hypothetical protein
VYATFVWGACSRAELPYPDTLSLSLSLSIICILQTNEKKLNQRTMHRDDASHHDHRARDLLVAVPLSGPPGGIVLGTRIRKVRIDAAGPPFCMFRSDASTCLAIRSQFNLVILLCVSGGGPGALVSAQVPLPISLLHYGGEFVCGVRGSPHDELGLDRGGYSDGRGRRGIPATGEKDAEEVGSSRCS